MHEGIVVDNSTFETRGTIYVTVPELFIGQDDSHARSTQAHIDNSKVRTDNPNLKYRTQIAHVNYIECYPIVMNNFTIGSLKPRRGNTVMVYFLNGDTKLPYYFNGHPLKQTEDIMSSSNEQIVQNDFYGYYRIIKLMADPMTGSDVYLIGNKLHEMGYGLNPDPETGSYYYDENMVEIVKMFQRRMGVTQDGEVGPITFRMISRFKVINLVS